jgi:hypothetical protein
VSGDSVLLVTTKTTAAFGGSCSPQSETASSPSSQASASPSSQRRDLTSSRLSFRLLLPSDEPTTR